VLEEDSMKGASAPNKRQRRVIEAEALIALLATTYPKSFARFEGRRRPLKVGIHLDLARDFLSRALEGTVSQAFWSSRALGEALRHYTHNPVYLQKLISGAVRVDLDGQPCGTVTAEAAVAAQAQLSDFAKKAEHPSIQTC
jgi:ProP effector